MGRRIRWREYWLRVKCEIPFLLVTHTKARVLFCFSQTDKFFSLSLCLCSPTASTHFSAEFSSIQTNYNPCSQRISQCAGKVVPIKKIQIYSFVNLLGVNTPIMANFKLWTWPSLNAKLGRYVQNWPLLAGLSWLSTPLVYVPILGTIMCKNRMF